MPLNALAFLLGICLICYIKNIPSLIWLSVSFIAWVCPIILFKVKSSFPLRIIGIGLSGLIGFSWVVIIIQQLLAWELPRHFEGKSIAAVGVIQGIPELYPEHVKFQFLVKTLSLQSQTIKKSAKIQLNWYGKYPKLLPGQCWHLTVRIKRPHGLANPGGFNHELHLLQNKIRAQGYVKMAPSNSLLMDSLWQAPLDKFRLYLLERIEVALKNSQYLGFIEALTIGVTQHITQPQWQLLRATGTNHLMAISGLHIGLAASLLYGLVNIGWRRIGSLALRVPTPQAAAIACLIAGATYSVIAGFSIPTQRALVMLGVFLALLLSRRQTSSWQALSLALFCVLIKDPLAILSVGFWLSFTAVAFIIYGTMGRYRPLGLWWRYGRVQWVVSLGLLPISLLIFQQASLSSLLANAIAIPWVSFTVVPIALSGALILPFWPWLAGWLFKIAVTSLNLVMQLLTYLASIKSLSWQQPIHQPWIFVCASIGTILLLAPRGFPGRWLGIIGLLPLFYIKAPTPKLAEVWFSVLDVGQGLAAIIRTQNHVVVYDTGPSFSATYNAGSAIIEPYLRYNGIRKIDTLIISHGDNDHSGGAHALLDEFPVSQVYTSVPQMFAAYQPFTCKAGQQWQWDRVKFEFLWPSHGSNLAGNNRSCVLKVTAGLHTILLPGDIEKQAEHILLTMRSSKLAANIVIAPHHGSLTSSTKPFIQTTHPSYVVFSAGYLNRFGFPKEQIVERYTNIGATNFNTAYCGMIMFYVKQAGITSQCYRAEKRGFIYHIS
jgi:competence protein ComEC